MYTLHVHREFCILTAIRPSSRAKCEKSKIFSDPSPPTKTCSKRPFSGPFLAPMPNRRHSAEGKRGSGLSPGLLSLLPLLPYLLPLRTTLSPAAGPRSPAGRSSRTIIYAKTRPKFAPQRDLTHFSPSLKPIRRGFHGFTRISDWELTTRCQAQIRRR